MLRPSSPSSSNAEDGPATLLPQVQKALEQQQAEEDLERQALHDSLTGLPNRSLLMDRLSQAILAARRHKGRSELSA